MFNSVLWNDSNSFVQKIHGLNNTVKMLKVLKIFLRVFLSLNKSYRLCGVRDLLVGEGFLLYPEILLYTQRPCLSLELSAVRDD